ncbi:DNA cytosine methyltransferase [Bacillus sp. PSXD-155]|uniref:DNA cytosine methyltransferase n=1 Tax=Bacillus sp. PSXD-155 TaxID=3404821 RepID=UPI003BB729A2
MPIYRKGEFFNGPGGFAAGARMARVVDANGEEYKVEHTWSNEICPDAAATYTNNICPTAPDTVIVQDVRTLDIETETRLGPIDAFVFGFPCNDFSIVGEQKGIDGDYGPLYSYGIRVLKHHQPQWFIAENVSGLQSANDGGAFVQILREMRDAGYKITPHLYKFEEYGVPQARHRIIIVGIRNDIDIEYRVPAPTHGPGREHPYVTASQALENIPEDAANHEFTRHTQKVIDMLNHIPPGENAWYEGIPEPLRLNVKGAKLSQIYKRLNPNLPSYTITGSGGGGTHGYHWDEPRALTNRERARIQTFPDDFVFLGGKEKVRQQIGMAVPPKAAKVIVESVLKTLAGIEYECTQPKWDVDQLLGQQDLPVLV